jgi:hypothetical protein
MLKIIDNHVWRGGEKIGWIEDSHHIYSQDGKKVGYFDEDYIYNIDGRKIGYFENDYLKSEDGNISLRIEDVREHVTGGPYSDHARCAIRLLLGE